MLHAMQRPYRWNENRTDPLANLISKAHLSFTEAQGMENILGGGEIPLSG